MKSGTDSVIRHCTLPDELAELRSLTERKNGAPVPSWPHIPGEGKDQAGWIWLQDGHPAGAAVLLQQTETRGVLHLAGSPDPDTRFELLKHAEIQAAAWDLKTIIAVLPAAPDANTGLALDGLAPCGKVTVLEAGPPFPDQVHDLPEDYFIKRFDEFNHLPTLAATLNRAYADRFGRPENEHGMVTVDSLGLDYSTSTWILLNFFGKGVAVLRSPADGWLEAPGIVPEERENGLHLSLLSRMLAQLPGQAGGWRMVSFNDPDSWLEDYRQAGFRITRTHLLYRKDL